MKIMLAAIALAVAAPAVAQTTDPHAGHDATHEQHKDCCDHKNPDGTRAADCCEQKDGKMMDCCEKHAGDKAEAHHEMGGR